MKKGLAGVERSVSKGSQGHQQGQWCLQGGIALIQNGTHHKILAFSEGKEE